MKTYNTNRFNELLNRQDGSESAFREKIMKECYVSEKTLGNIVSG